MWIDKRVVIAATALSAWLGGVGDLRAAGSGVMVALITCDNRAGEITAIGFPVTRVIGAVVKDMTESFESHTQVSYRVLLADQAPTASPPGHMKLRIRLDEEGMALMRCIAKGHRLAAISWTVDLSDRPRR